MHVSFLDPYHHGRSPVHSLDARIKLVLVVAFILSAALAPVGAWPVYVMLLALALAAETLTGLGLAFFLKRALLAVPFVLAALPVLFTVPGTPLLALPLGLSISAAGVERFASIALKSWISVQMAVLLASTTPFPEILMAMRALRLPRLLVAIIGLMWRYLFVMVDEALRLMRARESRSGSPEDGRQDGGRQDGGRKVGGSLPWRARVTGGMAGSLLLRSLERSDRIYNAMLSRGYDGEARGIPAPPLRREHWLILAAGLALLGALLALGMLL